MKSTSEIDTFLEQLQQEAELQAKLSHSRVLPSQLDAVTSLVGKYSWQSIAIISFCTAIGMFFLKNI